MIKYVIKPNPDRHSAFLYIIREKYQTASTCLVQCRNEDDAHLFLDALVKRTRTEGGTYIWRITLQNGKTDFIKTEENHRLSEQEIREKEMSLFLDRMDYTDLRFDHRIPNTNK